MNLTLCVFTTALIFAWQPCAATDLDKPIEPTKPTIRTEIYRGKEAASDCGIHTTGLQECVWAIQNSNVQKNTATDAFNAGLYFDAWLIAVIEVKVKGGDEDAALAMQLFKKTKEYQANLRIDNQALCAATRVNCVVVLRDMEQWEARLRAR